MGGGDIVSMVSGLAPRGRWGVRGRMIHHSGPYTDEFEQRSRLIAHRHHGVFPRPISNPTHPRHFIPCWAVVSGCGVISTISQARRPRQLQVVEETVDGLQARAVVVVRATLANSPLACRGEGVLPTGQRPPVERHRARAASPEPVGRAAGRPGRGRDAGDGRGARRRAACGRRAAGGRRAWPGHRGITM